MSSAQITVANSKASDMVGPKAEDLAQRRQRLKAKRKVKFYKMAWRTFLTTAIAVGTIKLATAPVWLIRSTDQIEVSNHQRLPKESVRALLPVPYPQSLVNVQPEMLASRLSEHPAIERAIVRRRLLPPGLQVQIIEKVPVAIALPQNSSLPTTQTTDETSPPFEEAGLIDAKGYWMPRDSFSALGASDDNIALQVIGMRTEDINDWTKIYSTISRSPVEITALDWSDRDSLILHSDLGKVHLGPYTRQFTAQLSALDQLRSLHEQTSPEQISFIRLQDPDNPIVEVIPSADASTDAQQLEQRSESPPKPALNSP